MDHDKGIAVVKVLNVLLKADLQRLLILVCMAVTMYVGRIAFNRHIQHMDELERATVRNAAALEALASGNVLLKQVATHVAICCQVPDSGTVRGTTQKRHRPD